MSRSDAENAFREVAAALVSLEQRQFPALHARLHGATLLVTQALATSRRMNDAEALATLARAAEVAAERLLTQNLEIPDPKYAALVNEAGNTLLTLAHQHALTRVVDLSKKTRHHAAQKSVASTPK
jgi:hypothetical protein